MQAVQLQPKKPTSKTSKFKRRSRFAVDPETHRLYTPEQEEYGKPVARMIVYEAVRGSNQLMYGSQAHRHSRELNSLRRISQSCFRWFFSTFGTIATFSNLSHQSFPQVGKETSCGIDGAIEIL